MVGCITKKFVTMHGHMNVKFRKMVYYHCCSPSTTTIIIIIIIGVVVVVVVVVVVARYFVAQVGIFLSLNTRKMDFFYYISA